MRGAPIQWSVRHAIEYCNGICHAEEPGPIWCTGTTKDGACSAFDLLDTMLGRVLILLVTLVLLTPYPVGAEKLVHTPHKLFMWVIRPDVGRNFMLVEAVLKKIGNNEARLESYCIYVSE